MKYFLDTEFIEGFKKPINWLPTIGRFNKPYHSIQLISMGIVAEDGREYYAISNEFNPEDASQWVKDNVIGPIYNELLEKENKKRGMLGILHLGDYSGQYTNKNLKYLLKVYGKSNAKIRQDILEFICPYEKASEYAGVASIDVGYEVYIKQNPPEFYAYYADYDWVVFCSLFGTMMDLPKGFPMYCRDMKQKIDECCMNDEKWMGTCNDFDKRLLLMKSWKNYPKETNQHNALSDAKWNYELYKFIQKL